MPINIRLLSGGVHKRFTIWKFPGAIPIDITEGVKVMHTTIIIAPSGMKRDLARALINDDAFAHRWMCHNGGSCSDGCDVQGDSTRIKLYQEIRVYDYNMNKEEYDSCLRGWRDANMGLSPIFRKVGS